MRTHIRAARRRGLKRRDAKSAAGGEARRAFWAGRLRLAGPGRRGAAWLCLKRFGGRGVRFPRRVRSKLWIRFSKGEEAVFGGFFYDLILVVAQALMSEWAAINLAECHSTVNGFEGMVRLSNIQWCCWDEFCFIAFGAEGCRVITARPIFALSAALYLRLTSLRDCFCCINGLNDFLKLSV